MDDKETNNAARSFYQRGQSAAQPIPTEAIREALTKLAMYAKDRESLTGKRMTERDILYFLENEYLVVVPDSKDTDKRDAGRWRLVQEWLSIDENEDGDIRLFCEPPYLDLNERCAPDGEMLPREQWPTVVQVVDELVAGIAPSTQVSG